MELPINFYRVKHEDYTRSGYDRGHMVRSEERTAKVEDNRSTFILTNILPQHPHLNQGVWFNFEAYLERLCKLENKKLYVIAGGIFHTKEKIGGVVTVPDSCFKIVVVLNKWETTLDITEDTPIIAVVMPNTGGIRRDKWEQYRTTVSRIEYSTGYKFLSAINEIVADSLKKK
jgi:endonuclease G